MRSNGDTGAPARGAGNLRAAAWLIGVSAMAIGGGCSSETTVVLAVGGDLIPGEHLDGLELSLWNEGAQIWSGLETAERGQFLTRTIRIAPGNQDGLSSRLSVVAVLEGAPVLTVDRSVGLVSGREAAVRVCLWQRCIGSTSESCRQGACEDVGPGGDGDGDGDADADGAVDADADGGCLWREVSPEESPSTRGTSAVVYDAARAVVVLFGGLGGGFLDDTWEYDGQFWSEANVELSPPGRDGHGMAYDSSRQRIVLYNGFHMVCDNDTWELDIHEWRDVSTATSPSVCFSFAMAYDSSREVVILTGEAAPSAADGLLETWQWDGSRWQLETPSASPPDRISHAMVYDESRGVMVLFGGCAESDGGGCNMPLGDTWEYDGEEWTEVSPSSSPAPRTSPAMAYDSRRERVVIHGGWADLEAGPFADTWEYDGAGWVEVTPLEGPDPAPRLAMAYDASRDVVVLVGGETGDDTVATWELTCP